MVSFPRLCRGNIIKQAKSLHRNPNLGIIMKWNVYFRMSIVPEILYMENISRVFFKETSREIYRRVSGSMLRIPTKELLIKNCSGRYRKKSGNLRKHTKRSISWIMEPFGIIISIPARSGVGVVGTAWCCPEKKPVSYTHLVISWFDTSFDLAASIITLFYEYAKKILKYSSVELELGFAILYI